MSRIAKRWAERVRRALRPRPKPETVELVLDLQIDPKTGRMIWSSAPVPPKAYERYLEDHGLVPETIEELSEATLLELVAAAERSGSAEDWRRALIQLAHHRSERASQLLEEVEARVPRKLRDYHELAYAESVGWLGLEYVRGPDGVPRLFPAGTLFPVIGPAEEEAAEPDERLPN